MNILSELWIYPIKSLGGISLQASKVEVPGLQYDRRWMLVNPEGRFMSQREIPEMALLRPEISDSFLRVGHFGATGEQVNVPLDIVETDLEQVVVEVWGDKCLAGLLPEPFSAWFSDALKQPLRLVQMPASTRRWADARYAPPGHYVSFADGFPFLVIGQASLDDLNSRLETPVPMDRFRPNFVFTGGQAFEEDQWSDFFIGDTAFRGVKPCARCSIPTTDQQTAVRAAEPIKTLATFRSADKKILFGQNVLYMGTGDDIVQVGDVLKQIPG